MLAYTRQMLAGSPQDPEDAVQEIFVRAYAGLRANRRELALRAWLYRIAHNRCIDELRRPHAVALETIYKQNLVPAVLRKPGAHGHLYDRLTAAGSPPAWPRPTPPERPNAVARVLVVVVPVTLLVTDSIRLVSACVLGSW